jgi:hypothetical protein
LLGTPVCKGQRREGAGVVGQQTWMNPMREEGREEGETLVKESSQLQEPEILPARPMGRSKQRFSYQSSLPCAAKAKR